MNDPLLQFLIAMPLALLFASAGVYKLRQSARFQAQLAAYELLPKKLLGATSTTLGLTELVIALALLLPLARPAAAISATVLLLTYAAAMTINLARGRNFIDCGCGDTPVLLSPWLLARNAVLAAAAAALSVPAGERTLTGADMIIAVFAIPVLIFTYRAAEQLLANASAFHEWRTHNG